MNTLAAVKWYWAQLTWPDNPAELNRGASWLGLTLDFVSSTGIRFIGAKHTDQTNLN